MQSTGELKVGIVRDSRVALRRRWRAVFRPKIVTCLAYRQLRVVRLLSVWLLAGPLLVGPLLAGPLLVGPLLVGAEVKCWWASNRMLH